MNDFQYALRQLLKRPAVTALAVLTLAFGIGANTAMFSIVNGVLLKPLPYPAPDQLVTLWELRAEQGTQPERVSGPNYLDWRRESTVLSDLAVTPGWSGSTEFNLLLATGPVKVRGTYASSSLFSTLGRQPLIGRPLLPEEDQHEGPRVAVLSYALWQRHFGGDTNILGRTLTLDTYGRRSYTIVGVMPQGFGLPGRAELWLPLGWMGVRLDERRTARWHNVIARLKPGVTLAQAQAHMNALQERISQRYPAEAVARRVSVVPMLDQALGRNTRGTLLLLWSVVTGVLLIACANLASLMLARAAARQKEIAVRFALGATRFRVARQLVVESVVLALIGGVAGAILARWVVGVFVAAAPLNIPRLGEVTVDVTALLFTAGIAIVAGLLFGLAPAWHFARPGNSPARALTSGMAAGESASRAHRGLVVLQIAMSFVLLLAAGLMLGTLSHMLREERGFNPESLLSVQLDFSVSGYTTWVEPTATRPQFTIADVIQRISGLPGVQTVGVGSRFLRRENAPPSQSFAIFERPVTRPEDRPMAEFQGISPGWLRAMGGRLLRGRDFTDSDTLTAPGVALINETLARRCFPEGDPIGKHIALDRGEQPLGARDAHGVAVWSEIVGVVADMKSLEPRPDTTPEVYRPYEQWPMQSPTVVVRTAQDPAGLAQAIRAQVRQAAPNLPPPLIRTVRDVMGESLAQPRVQAILLNLFGLLALLLAAVGLYGVLAYSVSERTREIGIRMALGARKASVLWLVFRQGMRLVCLGLVIGLFCALGAARILTSVLYGIPAAEPLVLAGISALLLSVATLACWFPARRATHVEPMEALRHD